MSYICNASDPIWDIGSQTQGEIYQGYSLLFILIEILLIGLTFKYSSLILSRLPMFVFYFSMHLLIISRILYLQGGVICFEKHIYIFFDQFPSTLGDMCILANLFMLFEFLHGENNGEIFEKFRKATLLLIFLDFVVFLILFLALCVLYLEQYIHIEDVLLFYAFCLQIIVTSMFVPTIILFWCKIAGNKGKAIISENKMLFFIHIYLSLSLFTRISHRILDYANEFEGIRDNTPVIYSILTIARITLTELIPSACLQYLLFSDKEEEEENEEQVEENNRISPKKTLLLYDDEDK